MKDGIINPFIEALPADFVKLFEQHYGGSPFNVEAPDPGLLQPAAAPVELPEPYRVVDNAVQPVGKN